MYQTFTIMRQNGGKRRSPLLITAYIKFGENKEEKNQQRRKELKIALHIINTNLNGLVA